MAPSNNGLLLLLVVIACGGGVLPCLAASRPFTETLDVSQQRLTGSTYSRFLAGLDLTVNRTADRWIERQPVLRPQTRQPAYWIHVKLKDAVGRRLVTLALRSDNLYIAGFENRHGDWFAFSEDQATIPGSTVLSYNGSYSGLLGNQGYRGLGSVLVNPAEALANAELLANYRPGNGASDGDTVLKPALVFYILTVAEAERFRPIREALAKAMDSTTPRTIPTPLPRLVVNWARLSCALRRWDYLGRTRRAWITTREASQLQREISVYYPAQALAKIWPLIHSNRCSWNQQ